MSIFEKLLGTEGAVLQLHYEVSFFKFTSTVFEYLKHRSLDKAGLVLISSLGR